MKPFKTLKGILELLVLITIPASIILLIWGVNPYMMKRIFGTAVVIFCVMFVAAGVKSVTDGHKNKTDKMNNTEPKRSTFEERIKRLHNEKPKK